MSEKQKQETPQTPETDRQAAQFLKEDARFWAEQVAELTQSTNSAELLRILETQDVPWNEFSPKIQTLLFHVVSSLSPILPPDEPKYNDLLFFAPCTTDLLELASQDTAVQYPLRDILARTRAEVLVAKHDTAADPVPQIQEDFIVRLAAYFLERDLRVPNALLLQLTPENTAALHAILVEYTDPNNETTQSTLQFLAKLEQEMREQLANAGTDEKFIERRMNQITTDAHTLLANEDTANMALATELQSLCNTYPSLRELCKKLVTTW